MSHGARASRGRGRPRLGSRNDGGETLIETVVALVVLTLTIPAVFAGFLTAADSGVTARRASDTEVVTRNFAQALVGAAYVPCAVTADYPVPTHLAGPSGYKIKVTQVSYWQRPTNPPAFVGICVTDSGLQRVTFTVTDQAGTVRSMSVLKGNTTASIVPLTTTTSPPTTAPPTTAPPTTAPPTTLPPGPVTCTVDGPDNTWVDEFLGQTNTNHNGDTAMNILYLAGSRRYSFIRFKLIPGVTTCEEGGTLPPGKTVTSATMRLYTFNIGGLPACGANSCWHVLERAQSDWSATTITWNNQPATTIPGQTLFQDGNGALSWDPRYQYVAGPALTADVQAFYSGSAPNYGWAIKEACAITYLKACGDISPGFQMRTSYYGTANQRPALTLVLS